MDNELLQGMDPGLLQALMGMIGGGQSPSTMWPDQDMFAGGPIQNYLGPDMSLFDPNQPQHIMPPGVTQTGGPGMPPAAPTQPQAGPQGTPQPQQAPSQQPTGPGLEMATSGKYNPQYINADINPYLQQISETLKEINKMTTSDPEDAKDVETVLKAAQDFVAKQKPPDFNKLLPRNILLMGVMSDALPANALNMPSREDAQLKWEISQKISWSDYLDATKQFWEIKAAKGLARSRELAALIEQMGAGMQAIEFISKYNENTAQTRTAIANLQKTGAFTFEDRMKTVNGFIAKVSDIDDDIEELEKARKKEKEGISKEEEKALISGNTYIQKGIQRGNYNIEDIEKKFLLKTPEQLMAMDYKTASTLLGTDLEKETWLRIKNSLVTVLQQRESRKEKEKKADDWYNSAIAAKKKDRKELVKGAEMVRGDMPWEAFQITESLMYPDESDTTTETTEAGQRLADKYGRKQEQQ